MPDGQKSVSGFLETEETVVRDRLLAMTVRLGSVAVVAIVN